ncbi:MAG TPA: TonB family protein [Mucilaginibacter sp.]|jgi:TonB family protein|nr:TonB family protein [Mucilaginibacter sp.]
MKITLLLLAVLMSSMLYAQTRRQTEESGNLAKVYHVLKSDKSIKEGAYTEHSIFGHWLICEGFYKNNLKDSLWKYYNFSNKVAETGYYKSGKKTGIWTANNFKGEPEITYDYTNKKLILYNPDPSSEIKQEVINGHDTVNVKLDQPAIYLDGITRFSITLAENIRYPAKARETNIQGKVLIAFTVDSLGLASNFRVKNGIGGGCDEEALRAVKLIEGDWLPAILNGKPVTVEVDMPVNFTLETR